MSMSQFSEEQKIKLRAIGKRIDSLAKERHMSHGKLARKVGVTPAAMTRYVEGDRAPNCLKIADMAKELETTTDYLINGTEESEEEKELRKSKELGGRIKIIEIATTYGYELQSGVLLEEASELIKAVCKYARAGYPAKTAKGLYDYGKGGQEFKGLVEEMADVRIMIEQCEFLLGCKDQVESEMDEKIRRQLQRIHNAENSICMPDPKL